MNITTACEPTLEPGVADFLKHHGAEAAFQKACELVRACFPELRAIHVWLLEDPDEDKHTWVVLQVFMPTSYPPELLRAQTARYDEELARQVALPYHPLSFSLMIDSTRE